ncbi:NAD-dependent epimerase/dehydratase family protein [Phycisphaera mikurensis]|uniref:Putative nucleotide-sugar epimerase n=1 Tax=Phycisphaera mikurensis (strain NBRC 102666 / KCTC 22515 / FYK2301M01) TaxID=1142394 RepID=I0IA83_PHYMF|nr:NAD-dependent epimerase/dehydratase family protein [Phycisphaera mikurensis]MBB6441827.1 dTDP-L-rhamnose 4-epimerase [Phycisphaera mikurensis]BAM02171.1 putative nucleotide-sugar epimerase [Phycisphaera mikurensis NBRC 102666]
MPSHVLVTGGAGFIGSHVVDRLLQAGHRVRVVDALDPQVHAATTGGGAHASIAAFPEHLDPTAEAVRGDLADPGVADAAVEGVDRVIHLAAAVGVGQSMYEIAGYTRANDLATAQLLEAIVRRRGAVKRLTVASSMSVYGEGRYEDADGDAVPPEATGRRREDLENDRWEPMDGAGRPLVPRPTAEDKPTDCSSVYALGKLVQEQMCGIVGDAYGIPTTALRFFNVYGPRQALSNPYTGVIAIFASRLLNGRRPRVFEDGQQRRDFVSVHDVADAVVASTLDDALPAGVFNIGSGASVCIRELAEQLASVLGRDDLTPELTGNFRIGDIRHCFADTGKAERELGFAPKVSLVEGMAELAGWLETQEAQDNVEAAGRELAERGLTV